ncbi:hypothetical protein JMUB5695_02136 [Mycobacterium heckeshornense]|nr:hypothetical protein JMUB5695_02136 [Mycobacterium heckeshornense]
MTWPLLSPASGEIPFTGRPHWLTSHYLTSWERGAGVTVRRLILLVGAVLLVAGVVGLLLPVSVTQEGGGSIGCGNAVASNLQEAKDKTPPDIPIVSQLVPHRNYVAECNSELAGRRSWSIPLTVIGVITVIGALFVRRSGGAVAGDV